MTIANIDVTPLVEKEFRKQMQHSLRVALQKFAPGVNAIQQQAQRSWSLLQEPVALGQGHWLVLRPAGVALSRISGRGNFIDTQLAVTLQPLLVTAPEAVGKLHPLPPLGQYISRSDGLDLQLGMKLDFTTLNRQLSDILAGQSLVIKDRKAGIEEIALAGSGQDLRARLELSGDIAGSAELRARLAYAAEQQKLQLQDLTFDYAAEDATMGLLAEAFHEQIRQALEVAANQVLSQQLVLLGERLRTVLKKITPAGVTLDMSAMQLRGVHLQILEQGIRLEGTASGRVQLLLR